MAEQEKSKKFGGNFKRQSELTVARNKRIKAERHKVRMARQGVKHAVRATLRRGYMVVPHGSARAQRRAQEGKREAWLKSIGE